MSQEQKMAETISETRLERACEVIGITICVVLVCAAYIVISGPVGIAITLLVIYVFLKWIITGKKS